MQTGWALGRQAFNLLKEHPKLVIFPLLSGLSFALLIAAIVTGAILKPTLFGINIVERGGHGRGGFEASLLSYAWGFTIYLTLAFLSTFFNTALCATVISHHTDGRVSLRAGFAGAWSRLPQILAWSVFAATVGLALAKIKQLLDEYFSWFGWIFGTLLETSWAAASFFVAPIIVVEGTGPIASITLSVTVLKERWGEAAGARFSTMAVLWPLHLAAALAFLGMFLPWYAPRNAAAFGVAIGSGVIFLCYFPIVIVLNAIMSGVVKSQLFIYAATGEAPRGCDPETYTRAFGKV
jgi:hypothetical protein